MDESLRRLLGEHTAEPTEVSQVDICATADAANLYIPADLSRFWSILSDTAIGDAEKGESSPIKGLISLESNSA